MLHLRRWSLQAQQGSCSQPCRISSTGQCRCSHRCTCSSSHHHHHRSQWHQCCHVQHPQQQSSKSRAGSKVNRRQSSSSQYGAPAQHQHRQSRRFLPRHPGRRSHRSQSRHHSRRHSRHCRLRSLASNPCSYQHPRLHQARSQRSSSQRARGSCPAILMVAVLVMLPRERRNLASRAAHPAASQPQGTVPPVENRQCCYRQAVAKRKPRQLQCPRRPLLPLPLQRHRRRRPSCHLAGSRCGAAAGPTCAGLQLRPARASLMVKIQCQMPRAGYGASSAPGRALSRRRAMLR